MAEQAFTKRDMEVGKKRCEKATGGPWRTCATKLSIGDVGLVAPGDDNVLAECFAEFHAKGDKHPEEARANADFITHARTYYPPALDALEEAWEFLTDIRAELLDCDEKKDLRFRLVRYLDGLEPAAERD